MKYIKDSNIISGAKDYYYIVSNKIDKIKKQIIITLLYNEHIEDGTTKIFYLDFNILNQIEYILDPNWDEQSNPPKPEGFDLLNPVTWGDLAWDEIPRVINSEKLYADKIINASENNITPIEQIIFEMLILLNKLPSSEEWRLI